jgi:adenylate cyclase
MKLLRRLRLGVNPASLTVGVILVVVLLFVYGAHILDAIELKTYDIRFRSRGPIQPSPAVVMAAIDEKSLDAEGRWPWPRSKIAALIDILSRDGARVIGFDIAFSEPDENSQMALIDQLARRMEALAIRDRRLADFIGESRRHADNDLAMATAIKRSSAAVVLGYFFHISDATLEYRLEPREIDRRLKRLAASRYSFIAHRAPDAGPVGFIKAYAPESNLELFSEVAASAGYFSLRSDPDGVLRWMPLVIQAGEDLFPPLAVACAWQYLGRPQLTLKVDRHGVEGVQMGDRFIPTDEAGQLLINYLGPPKTFARFSITDILRGQIPAGTFKDRIVLVGATALGTYDLRNTPFSPLYPGTEVHASVIDNILTRSFMARPEWSKIFDLLAIVALATLAGIVLPRLSPLQGLGFAAGLFVLYVFAAYSLFERASVWLNMVYPLLMTSA